MSAPYEMSAAADILTLSQRKSQKANFA